MKKETFNVVCDNCGKVFCQDKSSYNKSLKNKNHFCSRKCQQNFSRTGSIIKCENCGKEFYVSKHRLEISNHFFCCRKCAHNCINHSHPHSDETRKKISLGVLKHNKENDFTKSSLTQEQRKNIAQKAKESWNRKLLESDWNDLSYELKRKRVCIEQNNKCARCGIDSWQGKKIILEYEHKDGNHFNNDRDNVECLCPNCHSLTSTWRGRNRKCKKQESVNDEEIVNVFIREGNIRKTLIYFGMAAKGDNYAKVKRILKKYGILVK